jgi:hypothetical protein
VGWHIAMLEGVEILLPLGKTLAPPQKLQYNFN